jgi:hypothetical protein
MRDIRVRGFPQLQICHIKLFSYFDKGFIRRRATISLSCCAKETRFSLKPYKRSGGPDLRVQNDETGAEPA